MKEELRPLVEVPATESFSPQDKEAFAYYLENLIDHNHKVEKKAPQHIVKTLELVKVDIGSVDGDNPGPLYFLNAKTSAKEDEEEYELDALCYDVEEETGLEKVSLGILENGGRYLRRGEVVYVLDMETIEV